MEPGGGSGVVKPVNVDPEDVGLHDTDSSELSVSTASNTTLPHIDPTDVEKDEDRAKRKAAKKVRREAREKQREDTTNF
jgi:hypothetical protein